MLIIGCDFHPSFQKIAMLDTDTGEITKSKLPHKQEAVAFYRALRGRKVLIGIEACGYTQWFEQLLSELDHEYRIGDASAISAKAPRKQKNDDRDALHILDLLEKGDFPQIWVPSPAERDLRQLIVHRHKRVQVRTRVKNQLHALAINQGLQLKRKLWTASGRQQLEALPLGPYAAQRRKDLLAQLDEMDPAIAKLDQAVEREAQARPEVVRLMTHPGVGPVTALAFVLTIGRVSRFPRARQVASYLGLIPCEDSSAGKQRLGHLTKQGNALLRFLLVEAAHCAVRYDTELKRAYYRIVHKHHPGVAKAALARKLAVRLYWMLRLGVDYQQLQSVHMQAGPSHSVVAVKTDSLSGQPAS